MKAALPYKQNQLDKKILRKEKRLISFVSINAKINKILPSWIQLCKKRITYHSQVTLPQIRKAGTTFKNQCILPYQQAKKNNYVITLTDWRTKSKVSN